MLALILLGPMVLAFRAAADASCVLTVGVAPACAIAPGEDCPCDACLILAPEACRHDFDCQGEAGCVGISCEQGASGCEPGTRCEDVSIRSTCRCDADCAPGERCAPSGTTRSSPASGVTEHHTAHRCAARVDEQGTACSTDAECPSLHPCVGAGVLSCGERTRTYEYRPALEGRPPALEDGRCSGTHGTRCTAAPYAPCLEDAHCPTGFFCEEEEPRCYESTEPCTEGAACPGWGASCSGAAACEEPLSCHRRARCRARALPCASSSDCPEGWSCQRFLVGQTCGAGADERHLCYPDDPSFAGSSPEGATSPDCPVPEPRETCACDEAASPTLDPLLLGGALLLLTAVAVRLSGKRSLRRRR